MPKLIRLSEIPEYLPGVPPATVRYWTSVGKLAFVKVGRHRFVREDDLAAFVEAGYQPAVTP